MSTSATTAKSRTSRVSPWSLGNSSRSVEDFPPTQPLDVRTLRAGSVFTLSTTAGDLDLLAMPDPGFDFERLRANAIHAVVAGRDVLVASLDDLIAMKRAAGRPKDRIELEILGALREELDREP